MKRIVAVVWLAFIMAARAEDIGFAEDFGLADDRSEVLKQLIPGTEEHFYYHCLHGQNSGQLDQTRELINQWIKLHGYTARVEEMRNRQALLDYPKQPQATLAHLRQRLDLRFDHQKQQEVQKGSYPATLDQKLIAESVLLQAALGKYRNLGGIEDAGLPLMDGQMLTTERRRDLLRRLARPDYPNLVTLVVDDLKAENSRGFGEHGIHAKLLQPQLDECVKLVPELLRNTAFVNAYLSKLRPGEDVDLLVDTTANAAYLDRLWAFASRLPPSHNSLKASILFQRLTLDRQLGIYDRERFMEYLKLPRNAFYVNRDFINRPQSREGFVDLNANFKAQTLLPPIGSDDGLVRDYLQRFLLDEPDYKAFAEFVDETYLKELFAETKIVNGIGDAQKWYSLLPPAKLEALKDRVDLDFMPQNRMFFRPDEAVSLQVAVKNVRDLYIKVYEINTVNYYRQNGEEVTTAVDLDGLVAFDEQRVAIKDVPLARRMRSFDFPNLKRPGVYVIELIGNRRSSRALVRKGSHTVMERLGAAGHVLTIRDESGKVAADARVWMAGHEYETDAAGETVVPYTGSPGRQKIVVVRGGFATLHELPHRSESYLLEAGFHAERESLVEGQTCRLIVRPRLALNGMAIDIAQLEEPRLSIVSVDYDGTASSKEVEGFKLTQDGESAYEFKVPEKLASIGFTLSGKVQSLSENRKVDVSDSRSVQINGIDQTDRTECAFLKRCEGGYALDLLGKNGEVRANRPVQLELKHRLFKETVHATLQTDDRGRIDLGALDGLAWVRATGPEGTARTWPLPRDRHTASPIVQVAAGERVAIPWTGATNGIFAAFSIFEVTDGFYVRDCRAKGRIAGGYLNVQGLEPGDYEVFLPDPVEHVTVRVVEGVRDGDVVMGKTRYAEGGPALPLQVTGIAAADGKLTVRLSGATPRARVHIAASRFVGPDTLFDSLVLGADASGLLLARRPPVSLYVSGRDIGDEYQYVLQRKAAGRTIGNLLPRPSLLLNPWSLRKTEMDQQTAEEGQVWDAAAEPVVMKGLYGGRAAAAKSGRMGDRGDGAGDFASLGFLAGPAFVTNNLRPGADGVVTLPLGVLGARPRVQVLAVDDDGCAYRELALPETADTWRDIRLSRPLPADKHFAERKAVACLPAGGVFEAGDAATAKVEVYDSLGRVYALFATLTSDATLAEFSFVTTWPDLKPERKRELYGKYACHELSFFLSRKDPEFFAAVVKPHLASKKDKTFMDRLLLGEDLQPFAGSWEYQRLNIAERCLLARAVKDKAASTARHIKDLYDLIPPDLDRFDHLFLTALKGSALETEQPLALLQEAAAEARKPMAVPMSAAAMAPAAPAVVAMPAEAGEGLAADKRQIGRSLAAKPAAEYAKKDEEKSDAPAGDLGGSEGAALNAGRAERKALRYKADGQRRREVRQLYRKLDKTEEWAENNYYHRPIAEQVADFVGVNGFWKDYAAAADGPPFLSGSVAEAAGSFSEMLLALAVLDLPFKAAEPKATVEDGRLRLQAATPVLVFNKQILEAGPAEATEPFLVSQNFFARDDRYRYENSERFDKFIVDEFVIGRVYGCQVVLTNPTSARRKVSVLLQVPEGAIPVLKGFATRSLPVQVEPYATQSLEYFFYFPVPGAFRHFPVHVAQNERLVAAAAPAAFNVVAKPTRVDTGSWQYVSQNGTGAEVLAYLGDHNIGRVDLDLMAFRLRDKAFFGQAIELLRARRVYQHTLWSYGVMHNDVAAMREYLAHSPLAGQCGPCIESPLLSVDATARHAFQHLEYWPLVNPRALQLGRKRTILNREFFAQYDAYLRVLAYRPSLAAADRVAVAVYLLLQDRVAEAAGQLDRVKPADVGTGMQLDYLKAYLAVSSGKTADARKIAARYAEYPVPAWQNRFREVLAQIDEADGAATAVVDKDDRAQVQTRLADTSGSLDFAIEDGKLVVQYQNLAACTVNYYLMDLELLFSRSPFVQEVAGRFAVIRPNDTATVVLPAKRSMLTLDIPKAYRDRNVMVEIAAGGVTKTQTYCPNTLTVQVIENYGQLRVTSRPEGRPLAGVYVKTYARMRSGDVRFFKDGYTDIRGRFDYSSLNTDELGDVERFSLLILSDERGAVLREAAPPKM